MLPDPWFFAINLISALPTQIVYLFVLSKIFKPYSLKLYWPVTIGATLVGLLIKPQIPPLVTLIIGTSTAVLLPWLLLQGRPLRKMVFLLLGDIMMGVSEMPTALFWVGLTGTPTMDYEAVLSNIPTYLLTVVFYQAVFGLLMLVLYRFAKRLSFTNADDNRSSISQGKLPIPEAAAVDDLYEKCLPFLVVQVALMYALLLVSFWAFGNDLVGYAVVGVVFVVIAITDIALLHNMRCHIRKQIADLRVKVLDARIIDYLDAASEMQEVLQDAAKIRHDLRNHVQIASSLYERGQQEEAQEYLTTVAKMFER